MKFAAHSTLPIRNPALVERVHDIAGTPLAEVRLKIADLRRLERVLAEMVKACAQGMMLPCPLRETLAQGG